MGTIRNNFMTAFLPLVLVSSTSQSFWVHGSSEDSLKRNSSPDTITDSHSPSASSPNYECLYVDPNLPLCDFTLMLNSEEATARRDLFKRDVKRNIDISNVDVIVYTIEGCLPSRLPFRMPSCDGISLDRIVDVRRLRPFAVKGLTKPPFVFPKLNYSRWLRTVKRLQNRAPAKTRHQTGSTSSLRQSVQDLTEELMNAATTKMTMPNAIAASMKTSNGSSPNKLIPGDTESSESTDQLTESPENDWNDRNSVTREPSSNTEIPSVLQFHNELNSESQSNRDHLKSNNVGSEINAPSGDPDISEILAIQKSRFMNEESVMKEPSDVLSNYANSRKPLQFPITVEADETDDRVVDDLPLTVIAPAVLRGRREISLPVSGQEIDDEPKVLTVTGEPFSRRFQQNREASGFDSNQFSDNLKPKKQSDVRVDEQEMINENIPKVRIPLFKTKSGFKSGNKVKYDGWSGSKPTWQKSKKYRR